MQNQSTRQMPKWFLNNKQFLEFQKKTEQCQSSADTYQQSKCVSNFHFALPWFIHNSYSENKEKNTLIRNSTSIY